MCRPGSTAEGGCHGHLLRILVPTAALVAIAVGYDIPVSLIPVRTRDADIGVRLFAFVLVLGVAACWAMVDGSRLHLRAAAVVWIGTGTGYAVLASLRFQVEAFAAGADFRVSDLVGQTVLLGVLVVVPALLGASVGWSHRQGLQASRS